MARFATHLTNADRSITDGRRDYLLAAGLPALFVDGSLQVQDNTPAAAVLLRTTQLRGAMLADVSAPLGGVAVEDLARAVLDDGQPREELIHREGRAYLRKLQLHRGERGRALGVVLTCTDITAAFAGNCAVPGLAREAEVLHRAALLGAQSSDLDEVLSGALELICEFAGWAAGHAYLPRDGQLVSSRIWHVCKRDFEALRASAHSTCFNPGEGLPGKVFARARPLWVEDVAAADWFVRSLYGELRIESAIGVPICLDREVVAVLEFFTDEPAAPEPSLLRVIEGTSEQIGRAIERGRAIARLQQSHQELQAVLHSAKVGTWTWSSLNGRLRWSDNLERIHGRPTGSFEGDLERLLDEIHPADRESVVSAIGEVLRGGGMFLCEYRVEDDDGRVRWLEGKGHAVRDGRGRIIGLSGVCMDITAHKEIELKLQEREARLRQQTAALEEADQRKNELLAMLAHELRNPLGPIVGVAELLSARELSGGHEIARAIDILGRQAAHMADIVNDLLDVARITRGSIKVRRQPIDLREVVSEALEQVEAELEDEDRTLHVDLPERLSMVEGDRARLVQVIENLVDNAIKYTEPGGNIWLQVQHEGGELVISVMDDGLGIASSLLPHVFDTFAQGSAALHRPEGGLGLGLTLVRHLTELHGGRVEVESDGPGLGARFEIRLPALEAEVRRENAAPSTGCGPCKILLVDDNVDLAETMAMVLETGGHEVAIAIDGVTALEMVVRVEPDVVLLDIGMPELDGFEVARRLREQLGERRPLIIAVTGYGSDRDRQKALEAGFDHHLLKPVNLAELEAAMQRGRRDGVHCHTVSAVERAARLIHE